MEPNHKEILFPGLLSAAEHYLKELGLQDIRKIEITGDGKELLLEDVTAFIQIGGRIQGGFLFSVDHSLSRRLAKHFMIEEINEVEAAQYAVEVVAEVANIITAHSINETDTEDVFLGSPLMILSREMGVRAASCQMQGFETSSGGCRWFYIPKLDKTELASIVTVNSKS